MKVDGTLILAVLVIILIVILFLRNGKERYCSQLPSQYPRKQYSLQSIGIDPATIAEAGESEMDGI